MLILRKLLLVVIFLMLFNNSANSVIESEIQEMQKSCFISLGVDSYSSKDYKSAEKLLIKAIEIDSTDAEAHLWLSYVYYSDKNRRHSDEFSLFRKYVNSQSVLASYNSRQKVTDVELNQMIDSRNQVDIYDKLLMQVLIEIEELIIILKGVTYNTERTNRIERKFMDIKSKYIRSNKIRKYIYSQHYIDYLLTADSLSKTANNWQYLLDELNSLYDICDDESNVCAIYSSKISHYFSNLLRTQVSIYDINPNSKISTDNLMFNLERKRGFKYLESTLICEYWMAVKAISSSKKLIKRTNEASKEVFNRECDTSKMDVNQLSGNYPLSLPLIETASIIEKEKEEASQKQDRNRISGITEDKINNILNENIENASLKIRSDFIQNFKLLTLNGDGIVLSVKTLKPNLNYQIPRGNSYKIEIDENEPKYFLYAGGMMISLALIILAN